MQTKVFKKFTILFLVLSIGASFAADKKSKKDYIKDLESKVDTEVITAAQYLGKEEVKEAIEPINQVAKTHANPLVRVSAVTALGLMDRKGAPTTNLKVIIEQEKDNTVVYAALLAILNLKDFKNADAKLALDYCDQNKKDDIFITEAVSRLKKEIEKK